MSTYKAVKVGVMIAVLVATATFAFSVIASGPPTVTTLDAQTISLSSATLRGHESQTSTEQAIVWFEYGTNTSLSNGLSTGFTIISYPSSLDATFSAPVSGLAAGTTYYFRAVAKNTFGISHGTIRSFVTAGGPPPPPPPPTAPTVSTNPASAIGTGSARVNGTVNPNGNATRAWFEWGPTQSLGNMTTDQQLGAGNAGIDINDFLSGLAPNTIYYFRAAAQNSAGTSYGIIRSFTTQGTAVGSAPAVTTNSATDVSQSFATLNGTVNPNGSFTSAWFEYGTSQTNLTSAGTQDMGSGNASVAHAFTVQNLSANTTYYYRVVASNTHGVTHGSLLSFTTNQGQTQGSVPSVTTNSAFSITQNSATIQGTVNPNGLTTSASFEWGTSFGFGNSAGFQTVGGGQGTIALNTTLFGLSPNTTYYYRITAQNSAGSAVGSIFSFTTQSGTNGIGVPTVGTNSATGITLTSGTLNGFVDPNGSFTSAWFEYGTTFSLGNTIGHQGVGSGHGTTNYSANLFNLAPNTTYYFRAIAQNSFGNAYGSILTFTTGTQGTQPSAITFGASSVTQTTAYLQGAAAGNGSHATAWFEWGPTQSLGNAVGQQQIGSTFTSTNYATLLSGLTPGTTYYFRAVAQSNTGTAHGTIFSFTTGGSGFGTIPFVSTNGASFVDTTSAQLNSTVDPRGSNTTARFEWGSTQSLGNVTISRDLGSQHGTAQFSFVLTNLNPGTTYYYRVVAQNSFGSAPGTVISFRTRPLFAPAPPPAGGPPPPVLPPAPILTPSLVIEPQVNRTEPTPGETITYTLRYRNESASSAVSQVFVRILLPEHVAFVSSTVAPISQLSREVAFNLGGLSPRSNGEIELRLRIAEDAADGEHLAIGAITDWRDAANRAQSTSAYLTLTVSVAGFLAALFGVGVPLGWILLLILVALTAFFFARRIGRTPHASTPETPGFAFRRASGTSGH